MADVRYCPLKEKRHFVFLVIKWFVLPFNGRNLLDPLFLKRKPAVDAIYNYSRLMPTGRQVGCFIATCIVEDPLNTDRRKLSPDLKGFNIGTDGLVALAPSRVDKPVPG